jgi:hypothetical protein
MLSPWDDYPIHQTSYPVAHPVSNDAGRYDRHWLTLHDAALTKQVGVGLSVHPNRGLVDAAFSAVLDGVQHSVYASGPLSPSRDTAVGPLRIEVLEPMRSLRVLLEPTEGMSADLTWHGVTQTIEDGRMERWAGTTLISERTRIVQFGEWSGSFEVSGQTFAVARDTWWGLRDRSWGSRSTGTVAETTMSAQMSNIYFAWTLLRFDDECLLVAVNETSTGISEARTVAVLPFISDTDPAYGEDDKISRSDSFDFDIDYVPGTRRPTGVHLTVGPRGGIDRDVELRPELTFQMKGLGYGHPIWRHGTDHGGPAVGHQSWRVADCDPLAPENRHVQQLVTARRSDGAIGRGLFEHVAIGPHRPSGLA